MNLFACDSCDHVDAVEFAYPGGKPPKEDETGNVRWQCSKCQTGEWHNLFEYEKYRPNFDIVVNRATGLGLENNSSM